MDDHPPSPESANAPQDSSPPPTPVTPPPVIRTAPQSPPPLSMPPRPRSSAIWKVLTFIFLLLFVVTLFFNLTGTTRGVLPRGRGAVDRSRNLEEVAISSTNSDNKIAVIEVDGIIASGEIDRSGLDLVGYIKD